MSYERIFQIRYLYAVHVYVERDPPSRHKSTPAVGNCLWLISTKRDRLSNHTFDNYVFENQVKKVIIFCQLKKKYSSCQRTKMISQNFILTYGQPLVVILHLMSDQWFPVAAYMLMKMGNLVLLKHR